MRSAALNDFDRRVAEADGGPLHGLSIDTVQANIGLRCNLACRHCHVESSPGRAEEMDWPTMRLVLAAAREAGARTLDLTGGAPEMHPRFRAFIAAAAAQGLEVMVRTNLTILLEPGYEDLPELFRELKVHLVASLPCYLEKNVDGQRGKGVFDDSIATIVILNGLGYGVQPDLPLDLVYNPLGPHLPPPQEALEAAYRRELAARYGIRFTRLVAIANMPVGRFLLDLARQGKAEQYMEVLRNAFNPATIDGLMCRRQVNVGWDGTLYDCDFNYALGLPTSTRVRGHVRDFRPGELAARRIATGSHCFGCTAGQGSSCGGALA
ncbi:MAG: arsenosugar biosynthesis radical SAM protein ArsS [Planctomycetes bacterium]|nr:arsenosugar biosynthesis radical SAM protein ArsS [Planctomycetota bacterium]